MASLARADAGRVEPSRARRARRRASSRKGPRRASRVECEAEGPPPVHGCRDRPRQGADRDGLDGGLRRERRGSGVDLVAAVDTGGGRQKLCVKKEREKRERGTTITRRELVSVCREEGRQEKERRSIDY